MSVLSKYLSVIVWALAMLVLAVPASAQAQRDIAQDSAPFVYEVERLENGGGVGAPLDLDTPMGLVESFMAAGEAGEFERASAALDFAAIWGGSAALAKLLPS